MGAKGETFATQFEVKVKEATTLLEKLSDADWKKTTSAEKWTVGVVAHHVAQSHAGIAGLVDMVAKGKPLPHMTMDMIHEGNAKHAKEHANTTKAETLALSKENSAKAAGMVRGLSDEELERSAPLLGGPPMTSAQVIEVILINHVNEHLGSIKATTGAGG